MHSICWAFTTGYFANWHPLTWLSHILDIQLYGLHAGPHHVTSVLLHIINTLLLFGLLHAMTGAAGRSAFVSALFAVHPLHVESVAWVAERKDVLSTLFWFLTLWEYVKYARTPRKRIYLAVLLFFALGLMSKPMLVTLPIVLLLLDIWPLGRLPTEHGLANEAELNSARNIWSTGCRLFLEKLPLFALAAVSSVVTFVVQRRWGTISSLQAVSLTVRIENAFLTYTAYIGKMLWPTRLAAFYPYSRLISVWWVGGSILFLLGVSVVVFLFARTRPYLLIGWLWYLGTLTPVIGLVQVGGQARADRYTYVPLIGLFVMVAWVVPEMLAGWSYRRFALPAVAGLVIASLAFVANSQVQYWKNSITLWEHTLQVATASDIAHSNIAEALLVQGKIDEAIVQYSEALRINPNFAEVHNNLGAALASEGRFGEASNITPRPCASPLPSRRLITISG